LPGVRSGVIQGEGQEVGEVRDEGGERMRGEGDGGGRGRDRRGTTSFFGGSWNDMNFDQTAPGGGKSAFVTKNTCGILVCIGDFLLTQSQAS